MTELEKEILESTKEFAISNKVHYDDMTESMILNAMREYLDRIETKANITGIHTE